jgi:hypothetical protein
MEQVYASAPPSIVKFGEAIGPSIGVAFMIAAIPLIATYKSTIFRKILVYNLLLIMPIAIGFFSQYWSFVHKVAATYDVTGINDTLAYSTVNNSCIIVVVQTTLNSTCFAQNILTSLSYNYTNYYNIQPGIPPASSSQEFMPWAPTVRNYNKYDSDNNGQVLLISLCMLYVGEWLLIMILLGKAAADEESRENEIIELTNYASDRTQEYKLLNK